MAINKKLIHFNKKATFNSQKLSANDSNTQYQVGGTGTVQTGTPDINYQSIVYIKDSKEIWTHGQFYATAVTWSTITGKPSFATVATSGSYNDLNNKPTIPTKLPTPNALTFTGAVTGTWDGSSAKTVNIPSGSSYTLPLASNNTRGGIKLSSNTQGGTPNGITTTSGRTYAVQVNSNEQAVVNVPWTDTKYTLPTASASTLGGVKVGSGLAISNGVLSATGGGEVDSVAWGNVTGKPSWIGSSKPSYSWSEITSRPTLVKQVEPGTPSSDWKSAYVPLDVTYSDTSISHKIISLPMASPASDNSQGHAGLITGVDKKKLDALPSSGVSNIIKGEDSYVKCDNSFDDISIYAPNANVEITAGGTMNFTVGGVSMADFSADSNSHAVISLGEGYNYITLKGSTGTGNGVFVQASDGMFIEGKVSASGGYFDTSDARVKTNVRELNAINADAIKLVEFDRTDTEHHGYGVIAQEVEKVYPSVVNTDADGFKSVNYNEIAMIKIKSLEDKVARLEALVAKLESKLS